MVCATLIRRLHMGHAHVGWARCLRRRHVSCARVFLQRVCRPQAELLVIRAWNMYAVLVHDLCRYHAHGADANHGNGFMCAHMDDQAACFDRAELGAADSLCLVSSIVVRSLLNHIA